MHAPSNNAGPLAGLRVLDLSRFIAGPHCAMQLGDLGADVVKVERTGTGDDTRAFEPQVNGESLYFLVFNRNKRGITLNLRDPRAQDILRRLIAQADVLIENFRPGTMEKMGCGWDELHALNPRLIMARISGYGQLGPLATEPCFDAIAQAATGLMELTGPADGPPTVAGTFVVDYCTALYAAIGVTAALEQRHRSGVGQLVDVSLVGSAMSLLVTAIPAQAMLGQATSRVGNRDRFTAPGDVYRARDGKWVFLLSGSDALFPRIASVMERNDLLSDPRFSTLKDRMVNRAAIESIVAAWVAQHDGDEIVSRARAAEIPGAVVSTIGDVVRNPHWREAEHIVTVKHRTAGEYPMHGLPIRMSDTPASIRDASPTLGEHTEEVFREWLGMGPEQVATLRSEGIL